MAVSCVEHTAPFKCHPHNLVGKNCTKGVCIVQVDQSDMTATIQSIGIQCVKKKEMSDSLKIRKANGIGMKFMLNFPALFNGFFL